MRPLSFWVLGLAIACAAPAGGAEPAEALLRLVPADAGATLVVEDLKGHAARFLGSPLAEGLRQLPVVRDWRKSEQFQGFQQACRQIEKALGKPLPEIRDALLGDVVILTFHLPAAAPPDQARGLLLTRVRDRAVLDRTIDELNAAQKRDGEVEKIVAKDWNGTPYSLRVFRIAAKPAEAFTTLPDGVHAWSNSEKLIQDVIDRAAGKSKGLGDEPRFLTVRKRLPARAVVSLFGDPAVLKRVLLSGADPAKAASDDRVLALLVRHLGAAEYAGAALEVRDGLVLHTEETLNPDRLDPWLKRWAVEPSKADPAAWKVPPTAFAMATAHLNFNSLFEVVEALVPVADRVKLDNVLDVVRGLMLGRELRSAILPHLGPGALVYAEAPTGRDSGPGVPMALSVQVGGESVVSEAVGNALRTFLALNALDEKRGNGRLKVVTREIDGVEITSLSAESPFAYAIKQGRVVVGSAPETVARAFAGGGNSRIDQLRQAHFPAATSFACADLTSLRKFALDHRAELIKSQATQHNRPEADEARDFDQTLALIGLFEGAYLTSTMAPDATSIHRTLGFAARRP